jgi:hypothetical protein
MKRSWLRPLAVALLAAGLAGAPGWAAAASAAGPACAGVISITRLAFNPPAVSPGQLATANLTARNCTGQTQSASVLWLEQFTGPGGGIPAGCPVIDPLPPKQVTFAPFGSYSASSTTLVPPSCTATQLLATVRISGSGGVVLAQRTASLTIIQPSTGT